ncbi:MAG: hypothetical protein JKY23_00535, partial [Nitrospinaceae bacterium]|nr:hypothetical protein [Nitrospinaceae bacterium]
MRDAGGLGDNQTQVFPWELAAEQEQDGLDQGPDMAYPYSDPDVPWNLMDPAVFEPLYHVDFTSHGAAFAHPLYTATLQLALVQGEVDFLAEASTDASEAASSAGVAGEGTVMMWGAMTRR